MNCPLKLTLITVAISSILTSVGKAEEYTEYTAGSLSSPGSMVTPTPSNIGLFFDFALATSTIPPISVLPESFLDIDQNLDASNNGLLYIKGGSIRLQDFSYTTTVGIIGSATFIGKGLTLSFDSGPMTVTNGNFSLNPSFPGTVTISSGTLRIQGALLNIPIDGTLNYNANPLTNALTIVSGSVNGDSSGSDTDTSNHNGLPGITGISNIDTDGAEMSLNLNGVNLSQHFISGSIELPMTLTLSGSVSVSVPEVSSLILFGTIMSGCSLIWLRRSKG